MQNIIFDTRADFDDFGSYIFDQWPQALQA